METRRPKTAVEAAIDRATGFTGGDGTAPIKILMRCPHCKAQLRANAHGTDPEGTAVVESPCLLCVDREREVRYFDKDGNLIGQA